MWNAVQTATNCEPQVCKFLAVEGVESYAPQFPAPGRTRPGSVRGRRYRWVFPGYVFFRCPRGFSQWDRIRWAPGVRRVLQDGGSLAVITDEVVEHLRQRLTEGTLRTSRPQFTAGQALVIEKGPLRMVDAIFERQLDAPARVRILVRLLGRSVAVDVDPAILRAAG